MLIAQQKKKDNIAEYILYMWQIEDLIRAWKFDMRLIEKNIISGYKTDKKTYQEILDWYAKIIERMLSEDIMEKGHLQSTQKNIEELETYHEMLLYKKKNTEYKHLFESQANNILDFRKKSKAAQETGNIEVCFNALYSIILLRLQQKNITGETQNAIDGFGKLLAYLSNAYQKSRQNA